MKSRINLLMMVLLMLAPVSAALAYIGPGAGISVLGSLLGILATFFVAIGAILFWPLRKWSKRRKARRLSAGNAGASDSPEDGRS
jgi:membrane protein implicated in regulation of membrane protease activity